MNYLSISWLFMILFLSHIISKSFVFIVFVLSSAIFSTKLFISSSVIFSSSFISRNLNSLSITGTYYEKY